MVYGAPIADAQVDTGVLADKVSRPASYDRCTDGHASLRTP